MKTILANFNLGSKIPSRFLDKDAMKSCINFGKDIFYDRKKYRFNDLNRLVLVQYYKDGLL